MQTTTVASSASAPLIPEQLSAEKLKNSIAQVVSRLTGKSVDAAAATNLSLSEDLLYASIIHQRVEERFPGTGSRFLDSIGSSYATNVKNEKRQPLSKAVDAFLNGMVTRKQITAAKRDDLIEYAFGKSQLDNRKATLARAPENLTTQEPLGSGQNRLDPVLSRVAENESASKKTLNSFQQRIVNNPKLNDRQVRQQADVLARIFPAAVETSPAPAANPPPVSGPVETDKPGPIPDARKIITGPNDFAYKPESELDGKIVVMIPKRYRDNAVSGSIYALDGEKELVKMKNPRYGDDQRPYFRSDRVGTELEGGALFRVKLVDGSQVDFSIHDLKKFNSVSY